MQAALPEGGGINANTESEKNLFYPLGLGLFHH